MKQKFFVYLVMLFCVNNMQSMNIISSLHNLEKKLTQLKPFLAKQEPQKVELRDIPVPQLLIGLESLVALLTADAQNLAQNLKDLLSKASSVKPRDPIFQTIKETIKENFEKMVDNIIKCFGILTVIGNHFKKGSLEQDQKAKLISILDKLRDIFKPFKKLNLDPLEKSTETAFLQFSIDIKKNLIFLHGIEITISTIQNIILNSTRISTFITEDSEKIEKLEKEIRKKYDEVLQLFEQIKKSSSPEKKSELQELEQASKDLTQMPYDASFLIMKTIVYASFIKDNNLINILLTAIKSQDLKPSQKLTQEASQLESLYPEIGKLMEDVIESLENLEVAIQGAESTLKEF